MKCGQCQFGKKVHGCVGRIECVERGRFRNEWEGCELVEAVQAGDRERFNRIKAFDYDPWKNHMDKIGYTQTHTRYINETDNQFRSRIKASVIPGQITPQQIKEATQSFRDFYEKQRRERIKKCVVPGMVIQWGGKNVDILDECDQVIRSSKHNDRIEFYYWASNFGFFDRNEFKITHYPLEVGMVFDGTCTERFKISEVYYDSILAYIDSKTLGKYCIDMEKQDLIEAMNKGEIWLVSHDQ